MKNTVSRFFLRGLVAGGFGPIAFAVVYMILNCAADVEELSVNQLCIGIFSLYLLAFIVGGMNVIYSIDRRPLAFAILIHGGVLYVCYLATYLLNDWIKFGALPIMIFTVAFAVGYLFVWLIVVLSIKACAKRLNNRLK